MSSHFWALKAERQRSTRGETITIHSLQNSLSPGFWRTCLMLLCANVAPGATCTLQSTGWFWGKVFLFLTFWNFTCSRSIASTFYFVQANSPQHCHQPLSTVGSVFLRSFSAEPFQPPSYVTRPLEPLRTYLLLAHRSISISAESLKVIGKKMQIEYAYVQITFSQSKRLLQICSFLIFFSLLSVLLVWDLFHLSGI